MHASLLSARTAVAQTPASARRASSTRAVPRAAVTPRAMSAFYDLSAKTIDGDELKFDSFKGKPVLILNVACK
jgi:hypothetical protein